MVGGDGYGFFVIQLLSTPAYTYIFPNLIKSKRFFFQLSNTKQLYTFINFIYTFLIRVLVTNTNLPRGPHSYKIIHKFDINLIKCRPTTGSDKILLLSIKLIPLYKRPTVQYTININNI